MRQADANDRHKRFMLVVRQACLMIAAFVETETGAPGKATAALAAVDRPDEAPLQYRRLTDEECQRIAAHVGKRVTALDKP